MTIRNQLLALCGAVAALALSAPSASATVTCDGGTCTEIGTGTSGATFGAFTPQTTISSITNTWNQSTGVPAATNASLGQGVSWTDTQASKTLTLDAFYVDNPKGTTSQQAVSGGSNASVAFSATPGNGGFGVCATGAGENCKGNENGLQINYGTGNATNLDILQVSFSNNTWTPVGASVSNTNGPQDFVIYASNTALPTDGSLNYFDWLNTLTFLGANEDNKLCGTPAGTYGFYGYDSPTQPNPVGPNQNTNFVCTQSGNGDQYYFNNTQKFQFLFFVIDTATAPTNPNGSAQGNEGFFVEDIEGVTTEVPEPAALSLLGSCLLLLGVMQYRRRRIG